MQGGHVPKGQLLSSPNPDQLSSCDGSQANQRTSGVLHQNKEREFLVFSFGPEAVNFFRKGLVS